jgi:hypothetical protein
MRKLKNLVGVLADRHFNRDVIALHSGNESVQKLAMEALPIARQRQSQPATINLTVAPRMKRAQAR